uniref:Uncharacterized protein n=1 Tax=Oscillatoriales cyanobacterium SpSt-402 TaxID=2282168 RepID=A0A832H0H7_9CYAN
MQLLKIGNRIINPEAILHVSYDPSNFHPATREEWRECVVTFGRDDEQIFYNEEADQVWAYLSAKMHCRTIARREAVA